jgi:hypothetical protein
LLAASETLNPFHQTAIAVIQTKEAWDRGDSGAVGEGLVRVAEGVAASVMVVDAARAHAGEPVPPKAGEAGPGSPKSRGGTDVANPPRDTPAGVTPDATRPSHTTPPQHTPDAATAIDAPPTKTTPDAPAPSLPTKTAPDALPPTPPTPAVPAGADPQLPPPWVDLASVKPNTPKWSDRRALSDLGQHHVSHGVPDSGGTIAIARYDAQGNVHLKVFDSGDYETVLWDGPIGKVDVAVLPGKFGEQGKAGIDFGNAIEPLVNERIQKATGQDFFPKHSSTTGPDFMPRQTILPYVPRGQTHGTSPQN